MCALIMHMYVAFVTGSLMQTSLTTLVCSQLLGALCIHSSPLRTHSLKQGDKRDSQLVNSIKEICSGGGACCREKERALSGFLSPEEKKKMFLHHQRLSDWVR